MADEPNDRVVTCLRRIDAKVDCVIDDVQDLKSRTTDVEEALAGVNSRLDRLEIRFERVERRFDLAEVAH